MRSITELLTGQDPDSIGCPETKAPGDWVQIGSNRGVAYQIIHIENNTAWVRSHRDEGLTLVSRLQKICPPPPPQT